MPYFSLNISYQKNQPQVISASELKSLYFSNIPLKNPDGSSISDETINFWIEVSQKEIEEMLCLKLQKQAYLESRDYVYDDWIQWGFIPLTYPALKGLAVKGFLNTTLQVDYPKEWLSVKRSSEEMYNRSVSLVPVQGSANTLSNNVVFTGVAPYIGYFGRKQIPNYWDITYITGFDQVPLLIIKAITLKASISILSLASQNITGQPGIASKSISIDGLSQSVTTTANSNKLAFGALQDQWQKEFDKTIEMCNKKYTSITFGVL